LNYALEDGRQVFWIAVRVARTIPGSSSYKTAANRGKF